MGRKLPEYDPAKDGPYEASKRRLKIFKRVYQNYYSWRSLRESGDVGDVITVGEGPYTEDIYLGDLMTGHRVLGITAPQQAKAFDLICLQGYTESAATEVILPESQWSTPVQQYSDDALRKMVAAYDAKQRGEWDPQAALNRKRPSRKKEPVVTSVDTPLEVPEDVQDDPAPKFSRVDHLNWDVCSEDNQSLADYINAKTGLQITGQQVKAVAFLRSPWYSSPERVAHREEQAKLKESEKAKFAYETPEQREARFEAARRLKSLENAKAKADALQDEVRQLRIRAGLDPESGEPVSG